jgi:hypothetical protein
MKREKKLVTCPCCNALVMTAIEPDSELSCKNCLLDYWLDELTDSNHKFIGKMELMSIVYNFEEKRGRA